jgi:hypothetical protein
VTMAVPIPTTCSRCGRTLPSGRAAKLCGTCLHDTRKRPREVKPKTLDRGLHYAGWATPCEAGKTPHAPHPQTRAECPTERPCPYVGCRYHLHCDVTRTGNLILNFPDLQPWELTPSCALDVSDDGEHTLEEVGELLNLTRERIRQIEATALEKLHGSQAARILWIIWEEEGDDAD